MNRCLGLTGGGIGCLLINRWCKEHFPPEKIPELPPKPGYKAIGFMGCPESKVEEIRERKRLLFFTNKLAVSQLYAISRTSWWDQLKGADRPVVLQLEIRQETVITENDLWRDRRLNQQNGSPFPQFVSFYPAIPPEVQKRCDLEVRVHHLVTCDKKQEGGSLCRAVQAAIKKFSS